MKKGAICDEKIHDWLFFSVLFLITGCLIAGYQVSYNNLLEKEKAIELTKNEKNDSIQTQTQFSQRRVCFR